VVKHRRLRRFRLSLYGEVLRQHRLPTLLLGLSLLILGLLTWFQWIPWPQPPLERWLLGASLVALLYWAFCLMAPRLAYVQPRPDRIRIQIPFYRLNISYRRIRNTRPVDIAKAFSRTTTPRRYRRIIRRYHGQTALGIDLSSWPLPRWLLASLLGRMMLAPDQPGFILITREWMELSNQLEGLMSAWMDDQRQQVRHPGANVADILNGKED
jgi:hypothetical protein